MNKAFIFDMDGVLVDSERVSAAEEFPFMADVFGEEIATRIGSTMGVSVDEVYRKAVGYGTSVSKDVFVRKFDEMASSVYARAKLIEGTDTLVNYLVSKGFKLGLVSASRMNGIVQVLRQLPFRDTFEVVISINDSGLLSKPAPDGYLEALRRLTADAKNSIVLEDSNKGIESAKTAGCYVIGFSGNLPHGYKQEGADAYAGSMEDVIGIVDGRS